MRRHRPVLTNCPHCNIDLSGYPYPQRHIGQCPNRNVGAVLDRVFDVEVARPPDPAIPPPAPVVPAPEICRQIDRTLNDAYINPNEEEFPVPQEVNVTHNFDPNVADGTDGVHDVAEHAQQNQRRLRSLSRVERLQVELPSLLHRNDDNYSEVTGDATAAGSNMEEMYLMQYPTDRPGRKLPVIFSTLPQLATQVDVSPHLRRFDRLGEYQQYPRVHNDLVLDSLGITDPLAMYTRYADLPEDQHIDGITRPFPINYSEYMHRERHNMTSLPEDRCTMELYELLEKYNVPQSLLTDLRSVLHRYEGVRPMQIKTRKTFTSYLQQRYPTPAPQMIPVQLETPFDNSNYSHLRLMQSMTHVLCFDFKYQLLDLLSDYDLFSDVDNFSLDPSNRWDQRFHDEDPNLYQQGYIRLNELTGGSWYRETVEKIYSLHEAAMSEQAVTARQNSKLFEALRRPFVLPIILYVDKTGTDMMQRHPLEPVIFTLGIFNRRTRSNPRAWRLLGFIPNLEEKSSATKMFASSRSQYRGMSTRNYHTCMSVVLRTYRDFQEHTEENLGANLRLQLGSEWMDVKAYVPLAFVIGDGKSGDMLCGRFAGYNCNRMSRSCMVPFEESDNPLFQCQHLSFPFHSLLSLVAHGVSATDDDRRYRLLLDPDLYSQYLAELTQAEAAHMLRKLCHHRHASAFEDIDFGSTTNGILDSTPTDLMHAFSEGIVKHFLRGLITPLSATHKAHIDQLVALICERLRSFARRDYPRCNFTHGYTNLTQLTAEEWPGMVMVLLILCVLPIGQQVLNGNLYVTSDNMSDGTSLDMRMYDTPPQEYDYSRFCQSLNDSSCGVQEQPDNNNAANADDESDSTAGSDDESDVPTPSRRFSPTITRTQLIETLERLLAFHAWYKRGDPYIWDAHAVSSVTASKKSKAVSSNQMQGDIDHSLDEPEDYPEEETNSGQDTPPTTMERFYRIQIRELMSMLVCRTPRTEGNGWKLQKFHEILHIPREMSRFGSPANWDAGIGESSLKYWAKWPSRSALNKSGSKAFVQSCGRRIHERSCFNKMKRAVASYDSVFGGDFVADQHILEHEDDEEEMGDDQAGNLGIGADDGNESTATSTFTRSSIDNASSHQHYIQGKAKYQITYNPTVGKCSFQYPVTSRFHIHPSILRFAQSLYRTKQTVVEDLLEFTISESTIIYGYTEYKNERGDIYRCHPDYRHTGSWYDWAIVRWADKFSISKKVPLDHHPEHPRDEIPGKIVAFLQIGDLRKNTVAVVHTAEKLYHDGHSNTKITETWSMEYEKPVSVPDPHGSATRTHLYPKLRAVRLGTLQKPALVFENYPGFHETLSFNPSQGRNNEYKKIVVRMKSRDSHWPKAFYLPHYSRAFKKKPIVVSENKSSDTVESDDPDADRISSAHVECKTISLDLTKVDRYVASHSV